MAISEYYKKTKLKTFNPVLLANVCLTTKLAPTFSPTKCTTTRPEPSMRVSSSIAHKRASRSCVCARVHISRVHLFIFASQLGRRLKEPENTKVHRRKLGHNAKNIFFYRTSSPISLSHTLSRISLCHAFCNSL
jgi:hypothetical protein